MHCDANCYNKVVNLMQAALISLHEPAWLAITSIYLPPLPFFFAPPFLAAAGPIRSSILLALLMLVGGLLGGPEPKVGTPATSPGGPARSAGVPALLGGPDTNGPPFGAIEALAALGAGAPMAPIPRLLGGPDAARNPLGGGVPRPSGPFGGGGVGAAVASCSAPAFLLTHFLRSGSYTNEFSSPSLALIGPVWGAFGSFLPNQPPNHEDLCWRF